MKKRIGSVLLALALCLSLLPATALAEGEGDTESGTTMPSAAMPSYSGGSGTEADPWLISTADDLKTLAGTVNNGEDYEDQYFIITDDIDLQNVSWTPIGDGTNDFCGTFDGQGNTIFNVAIGTVEDPLQAEVFGLFGSLSGTIQNLNLDTLSINGLPAFSGPYLIAYAGALVGYAGGVIENCHSTNASVIIHTPSDSAMYKMYGIGGLMGYAARGSQISECSVSGSIKDLTGIDGMVGGFIGGMGETATIKYSRADVALNVKSDAYGANVGGFIGAVNGNSNPATIISNCYATGNVTGGSYSGGFAGSLVGLNIKNCYATGDVTGAFASMATFAGTDAPAAYAYGSVTNCYTTGKVVGTASSTYAFAYQDATKRSPITNCYFADTNSAIKNQYETAESKTPEEMQAEGFKDALNASSPTNGWIFREGKTPLCGAEPADYDAVDAAIEKANALNENDYKDFSAVKAALDAVVRGKKITEQTEVDAMAKAIEDAIAALVKKPSPSSSSSSSSSRPSYPITTPDKTENGSVTVTPKSAKRGSVVTITVTPDAGYVLDKLTVTDKDGKELSLTKKSDTEYTFVMPAGKVEITPSFVKQAEEPSRVFVDVKTGDYFYDAVQWAVGKGITNGTSAETFSPEDPCTRAQIVTFLWRAAGSPVVNYAMDLSDVAGDAYYAEAVRWALSEGITTGTSADQFSPDATCTRKQAVTFLYRAAGSPAVSGESAFEDVGADAYYARAVAWAAQNGVTNGISQALFGTGSDCTRAQIVTFLYRAQQGK